jgi:dTDP-4-amino-4,6-dideoxy-D-glucose acyltransferase
MGVLSQQQIEAMGFAYVAPDARLSDRASFYNCAQISIGARTRIDDFCVLSAGEGGITIGKNVHIAVFCCLMGKGVIHVDDFANLSSRIAVYSSTDDYSGEAMTNPTVPGEFTNVHSAPVHIGRHVIVGSGSVILPGVALAEGVAVGALSLVKNDCQAFGIYAGNPARYIRQRKDGFLALEKAYQRTLS